MKSTLKEEILQVIESLEQYADKEKVRVDVTDNSHWYALGIEKACELIKERVEKAEKKH